jgi:hypothetical protein
MAVKKPLDESQIPVLSLRWKPELPVEDVPTVEETPHLAETTEPDFEENAETAHRCGSWIRT